MINVSATPGEFELRLSRGRRRRADHPADRPGRSRGRHPPGARARWTTCCNEIRVRERAAGARARHHAHQADVRGPDRLPPAGRRAGAVPALRHRRHRADGDPPRPPARRLRRARRHQPAARGPRPARGVAGRHSRRRPGGLPPQRPVAGADDRPRGAPRERPGDPLRRPDHRLDAARARRDGPAAARSSSAYNDEHGITPRVDRQVDGGGAALDPRRRCPHRAARARGARCRTGSTSTIRRGARR